MKSLILSLTICLSIFCNLSLSQDRYRVLPPDFNADKSQQMMRAWLRTQAHQALDRRQQELEAALTSPEKFSVYQQQRRETLRRSLGEMPPRTPLNPKNTGTIQADGFTIEKLYFESQPGFYVTANLYRPAGNGPFPAILHPLGHSENGKAYSAYQRANQLLVKHGFIVLCFDPIGQGERKQIMDSDGKPAHRASHEHEELGVAPILLGRGLGSYMVWDAVRALDYLCSRPDVDARRIGCTGNSGGGNLTSFLMAYDERIQAAAPGCFMTTHRRKNESPGPGDAEQNLYAQIRDGFDHPDFILSRAPKPTLILAATHDFVPIAGTWEAYRQAKRAYTALGYPERVALIEANEKHGFSQRLREGATRFFALWLQGRQFDVFEEEPVQVYADQELQVTPAGQVLQLPGARSLLEVNRDEERRLAAQRPQLTRDLIRKVAGIRPLKNLPEPRVELVGADGARANWMGSEGKSQAGSEAPLKLLFHPTPGIVLPALYWPQGSAQPVLLAPEAGMNGAVKEARQLNQSGHPVLIVEVRDTGETATRNWRFFGADYYIASMLGRCWLGMRAEDLLICARWLKDDSRSDSVHLTAEGELTPAALHAAALEPELISRLTSRKGLASWRSLMTEPDAHQHIHNAVQAGLRYYDLPDLKTLIHTTP
ncbi:Acetyl xylan esterase (AXE1) [Gimesia panareensis]|uniref:Acetyl xylan esterase (AXE1) n=1 Tax=Gimesia panareensis TaxID=2527978 RepID=A0A517Q451_9PLAN|nr:acetylxylan esterase [Gimesia panareensis]QDT26394.1 Acetyl xylan esterase (AXE1) [Gimesia panareensis]